MARRECYGHVVRSATLARIVLLVLAVPAALVGCNDLREFRGTWQGPRVGDERALLAGIDPSATATLAIDEISEHRIAARLTVDGSLTDVAIHSLDAAEADVLAGITHSGNPLRVYLTFVPVPDGGDALGVISLYDDRRVEVRLVRGGDTKLYGVFALTEQAPASSP